MSGKDDFLWWQRRAILILCASIALYGLLVRPVLLIMLPSLAVVSAIIVQRIRGERGQS